MSSIDLMLMGVKNLWRRKTRTILTILGVVIGSMAIVVMLSLGFGIKKSMEDQLEKMGGLTVIQVREGWREPMDDKKSKKDDDAVYLDEQAVSEFYALPNVVGVLAKKNIQFQLKVGKKVSYVDFNVVDFNELQKFGHELESGRFPTDLDKNAIVVGATTNTQFYDPTGRGSMEDTSIDLYKSSVKGFLNGDMTMNGKKKRGMKVEVVGTLKGKGSWLDSASYMSFKTYENFKKMDDKKYGDKSVKKKRKRKGQRESIYNVVEVKVDKVGNVAAVKQLLDDMGYETWSNAEILEGNKKTMLIIQGVLGGIGAVSLLIAAIGITNTMIMAIYERTKEIGVMKVLGAKLRDIKRLFLFEAAFIGLFGGIIGLILSVLSSNLINNIFMNMNGEDGMGMTTISYIPWYLMAGALVFSTLIGIISGYYPARRAMKLSALKAITSN